MKTKRMVMLVVMAALISIAGGVAYADGKGAGRGHGKGPMTPGLAAKREMVRKQQEQRITPEKRQAAVEALKAERLRVYRAKQAVKGSSPFDKDGK